MKLNRKQKAFNRVHKYTVIEVNGIMCSLKPDSTCVPATPEQAGNFIMFTPKTFWGEVKKDFTNIGEIVRTKQAIFKKWQFKVLCDSKSKLHNGRRYYVLTDLNGDYRVINREGFKLLKVKGLINKHANFMDLMKEAVYISGQKRQVIMEKQELNIGGVSEGDLLLKRLFHHIDKPSKRWPQITVGKRKENETVWTTGGVDDEFRGCLVAIEKYLNSH